MGKSFAQYVTHLRLVSLKPPGGKPTVGPLDRFFERRRGKNTQKLEKLRYHLRHRDGVFSNIRLRRDWRKLLLLGIRHRFLHVRLRTPLPSPTSPSHPARGFSFRHVYRRTSIYHHSASYMIPLRVDIPRRSLSFADIPNECPAPSLISGFAGTCSCKASTYLS